MPNNWGVLTLRHKGTSKGTERVELALRRRIKAAPRCRWHRRRYFPFPSLGLGLEDVEVVGGSDVTPEPGQDRAEEWGCPFYPDHRQMLAETKPDVTVIITPHPFHAPIAIDALNAGSHVLVEKPIAIQVKDADAMIAAARANKRVLAVNYQYRQLPHVRAMKRLIDGGQLGRIQRVTGVFPWMRTAAYYRRGGWRGTWKGEGGGVLMNQAPHDLDLVCHLVGLPQRGLRGDLHPPARDPDRGYRHRAAGMAGGRAGHHLFQHDRKRPAHV